MKNRKMPSSFRKHIRKEKARIRREILDSEKREQLIKELYLKFEPREKDSQVEMRKPKLKPEVKSETKVEPKNKKEKPKQEPAGKKENQKAKLKSKKKKNEDK